MGRSIDPRVTTLVASLIWGTSFVSVRFGSNSLDPFTFLLYRMVVASLFGLFLIAFLRRASDLGMMRRREVWYLAMLNSGAFLLQYLGLAMTTATKGALIIGLNIFFIALLAMVLLGERIGGKKILTILLAAAGVFLLTTKGDMASLGTGGFTGDMLVFGAGFLWAMYIVYTKKLFDGDTGWTPFSLLITVTMATSMLIIAPCLLLASPGEVMNPFLTVNVLFLGIGATIGAYFLWLYGIEKISATFSSLILLAEIVFAAMLASLFLEGESLGFIGTFGAVLIMLAILILNIQMSKTEALAKNSS